MRFCVSRCGTSISSLFSVDSSQRTVRRGEVYGLPLIHDKTVDEWGTEDLGYFMTGPPATRPYQCSRVS